MSAVRICCLAICLLFVSVTLTFAQSYAPFGPQTDVPKSTVTGGGWTECYSAPYSQSTLEDLGAIQAACDGDHIMLACAPTGSDTLTLLSEATASEVFTDSGGGETDSHVANGAQWYFHYEGTDNIFGSWGFAEAGDTLLRDSCDVASGVHPELRLCWHLDSGGGYRCGTTDSLNDSTEWTKYVYTAAPEVPTVAPWQLVVLALLLIGCGAILSRRLSMPSTHLE